ncbi:hypothetical protein SODALDRAFT_333382 [Sodiomyces alkalinus F11]|uniref:Uncharacterized protein n=1 Tax=Sodiomyces alkalinus (strain CBS 110278 / VKM F-3762 / F11) TaxID=1314773 RepID=A0A3N2PWP7_SODAK|nr:hypothetical protein SODALDRAFT_333382 [Sodiomyces alkalinus F11]ROT38755.1 hypothetical protein SODALDRAFT_333382 [Sodiomyces alkalinus F11]
MATRAAASLSPNSMSCSPAPGVPFARFRCGVWRVACGVSDIFHLQSLPLITIIRPHTALPAFHRNLNS